MSNTAPLPPAQSVAAAPQIDPQRVAMLEHEQHEQAIREAAVNSDMRVHLDDASAQAIHTPGAVYGTAMVPQSPYVLMRGMMIPATLVTSIDSSIPGLVLAIVSQDVFDSQHKVVVVPRGSRVTGTYASGTIQGQRRLAVAWDEIQLPDSSTLELENMPGIDLAGTAGFGAAVDNHTRKLFTHVLLLSALSAGAQLSQPSNASCTASTGYCAPTIGQQMGGAVGSNLTQAGTQVIQRDANIEPTLHVVEGAQVGIMVIHTIPLKPWGQ